MAAVKLSFPLSLRLSLNTLVIVMLAMLMAVPSRADEVTFLDNTETPSVSTSSTRISVINVTGCLPPAPGSTEECRAIILAPSGSLFSGATFMNVFIGTESNGSFSDVIEIIPSSDGTSALVTLVSDPPGGAFGGTCANVGGCQVIEDGTVRFGDSITWTNPLTGAKTTDNIFFQSNLDTPVPEPASLVLLGSGFLAVVGYIRRRQRA